jgi:hypothetical protein
MEEVASFAKKIKCLIQAEDSEEVAADRLEPLSVKQAAA